MSADELIGHLTVRIPVYAVTESESWEIPEEYTYVNAGDAELVSHDVPASWHGNLREDLIEGGLTLAPWSVEELAAKTTTPEQPAPTARPLVGHHHFLKGTQ